MPVNGFCAAQAVGQLDALFIRNDGFRARIRGCNLDLRFAIGAVGAVRSFPNGVALVGDGEGILLQQPFQFGIVCRIVLQILLQVCIQIRDILRSGAVFVQPDLLHCIVHYRTGGVIFGQVIEAILLVICRR